MSARTESPPKEVEMLRAMEISKNNPEAAQYLYEQTSKKVVEETVKPFFDQLVTHLKNFTQEVGMRCGINSSDSWSGHKSDITPFKNLHMNLADSAVEALNTQRKDEAATPEHALDYSVSEEGQLVRGWK